MVRKSLISVILVVMMIFAAGLAFAYDIDGLRSDNDLGGYNVSVNPGNLGDTLIGGYFNTRGIGNFFTIVNTSDVSGVVARIRFREATESEEVLDFNICLSVNDVFAGILIDDGSQTRLFQLQSDTTLTNPVLPDGGVAFKHSGNGGLPTVTADETQEGYYEIIGLITYDAKPTSCPTATVGMGPTNDVPNVLTGSHFMNEDGTLNLYGYRMMALADFNNIGIPTANLGSENITLANAVGGRSAVDWATTKANFSSEYMVFNNNDPIIGNITGESAYVVNFLTKKLNLEDGTGKFGDAQNCPDEDSSYLSGGDTRGVTIGVEIYDENENTIVDPEQFSPTVTTEIELCYEVNVIELGGSDILDSGVEIDISTGDFGFGWIHVDLVNGVAAHSQLSSGAASVTNGLPSWVTWLQTVNNVLSHEQEVAYETDITGSIN